MGDIKTNFDILFNLNNPIYYSFLGALAFFSLIYLFYRYLLRPIQKSYSIQKKELELRNARLMALFTELDPDPVIRINSNGEIIHLNDAAALLGDKLSIKGGNIREIIPEIDFDIKAHIRGNKSVSLYYTLNNKYYSILIRGTSYLDIAQVYFRDFTERKLFEEKLKESQERLKELSNHLQNKLEEERQRIAMEIHDGVGQNLLLIKMKMQSLEHAAELDKKKKDYFQIISSLENTINDLKSLMYNLKPRILEEMGLKPALISLCNDITKSGALNGSVDFAGINERMDRKLELALYRITQEALTNIVKHSKAKNIHIHLREDEDTLKLIISDDGVGFDFENTVLDSKGQKNLGLLNMQERVENFNGKIKIESNPDEGTIIIIEIPKEVIEIG